MAIGVCNRLQHEHPWEVLEIGISTIPLPGVVLFGFARWVIVRSGCRGITTRSEQWRFGGTGAARLSRPPYRSPDDFAEITLLTVLAIQLIFPRSMQIGEGCWRASRDVSAQKRSRSP